MYNRVLKLAEENDQHKVKFDLQTPNQDRQTDTHVMFDLQIDSDKGGFILYLVALETLELMNELCSKRIQQRDERGGKNSPAEARWTSWCSRLTGAT
jgi:hypothetical protein